MEKQEQKTKSQQKQKSKKDAYKQDKFIKGFFLSNTLK